MLTPLPFGCVRSLRRQVSGGSAAVGVGVDGHDRAWTQMDFSYKSMAGNLKTAYPSDEEEWGRAHGYGARAETHNRCAAATVGGAAALLCGLSEEEDFEGPTRRKVSHVTGAPSPTLPRCPCAVH